MVWSEIAASSAARERKDGWRDKDHALDPESDWKSDRSGMLSMGGRNVVEHESDMQRWSVYSCSTARHRPYRTHRAG